MINLFTYAVLTLLVVICLLAAVAGTGIAVSLEIKDWWRAHHLFGDKNLLPH